MSKWSIDRMAVNKKNNKPAFSKKLAGWILAGDLILSISTLGICVLAILNNFQGSLPYLVSLIGLFNASTAFVLGKYFDKSKAENTSGGIVYENMIRNPDVDC
jgi:hypothetical protein